MKPHGFVEHSQHPLTTTISATSNNFEDRTASVTKIESLHWLRFGHYQHLKLTQLKLQPKIYEFDLPPRPRPRSPICILTSAWIRSWSAETNAQPEMFSLFQRPDLVVADVVRKRVDVVSDSPMPKRISLTTSFPGSQYNCTSVIGSVTCMVLYFAFCIIFLPKSSVTSNNFRNFNFLSLNDW